MTQNKQRPMTVPVLAVDHSYIEWAGTPDLVEFYVNPGTIKRIFGVMDLCASENLKTVEISFGDIPADMDKGYRFYLDEEKWEDGGTWSQVTSFDPGFSLQTPYFKIWRDGLRLVMPLRQSKDEVWSGWILPEALVTASDKAWVESFGYGFYRVGGEHDMTVPEPQGAKWICADPQDGEDGFGIECDSLAECVQEAADWLQDGLDDDALPRPVYTLNGEPVRGFARKNDDGAHTPVRPTMGG